MLGPLLTTAQSDATDSTSAKSPAAPKSYSIRDARERGAFDMGQALGGLSTFQDEDAGHEVLKFDFQASPRTHTGAWTKKYPWGLKPAVVDAAKIGVRAANPALLSQISVKVEIKGKKGVQTIPLRLKPGWNHYREPIQWGGIGDLGEVVFVVSPTISTGQVEGILYFDLDFFKLTFAQKYQTPLKVGLVFVAAILLALIMAIFYKLPGLSRARVTAQSSMVTVIASEAKQTQKKRDGSIF